MTGHKNWFVGVLGVFALSVAAIAGDENKSSQSQEDESAMMAAWMKAGTPGEHHAHLAAVAGDWTVKMRYWFTPDMPAQESEGSSRKELILGGRYLKEEYSGSTPMGPFQGLGLTAYDNMKGKYLNTWMDSMSTTIMVSEGTCSADGKIITLIGYYDDPMDGLHKKSRMVQQVISADKHTAVMYMTPPGGEEFKSMEIEYTRGKSAAPEFSVRKVQPTPMVSIRLTTTQSEIGTALSTILPEVNAFLAEKGIQPAGPPFTRYHEFSEERVVLEGGMPVSRVVEGTERIKAGELTGGSVAVAWHQGPYQTLGETHRSLHEWMSQKGLVSAGPCWEVYWTDPGEVADSQQWRTEVLYPVQER